MTRKAAVSAPAKVNLFLRVKERRPDGFHEIETLFQSISLADDVVVRLSTGTPRTISDAQWDDSGRVSLQVDGPDLGPVSGNLAVRAARRFLEETGDRETFAHIRLLKRIPTGAGLGGGSSDGAAVLRLMAALSEQTHEGLPRRIAAELGSDVPFFLEPTALAIGTGRGERLRALRPLPEAYLVLALPAEHTDTAEAYRELSAHRRAGEPRDPDRSMAPWEGVSGDDLTWSAVVAHATNDFQRLAASRHASVQASLEGLRAHGAFLAMLSGSGSAGFGVFPGRAESEEAALALSRSLGWPFQAVRSLRYAPDVRVQRG